MERFVSTRIGVAMAVCASTMVLLGTPAHAAAAPRSTTTTSTNAPVADQQGAPLADPGAVIEVAPPAPPPPPPPEPPPGATTTTPPAVSPSKGLPSEPGTTVGTSIRQDPGYGSAARQPAAVKRTEAKHACVKNRPPTSAMLGVGGIVAGNAGTRWSWLAILIAVAALLVALAAFAIRRRRSSKHATQAPRGPLETVATIVGVVGAIAGLAIQLFPGIGINEQPPPEATMKVRDVQARITRGEYASRIHVAVEKAIDKREVGNVVWLEIGLQGYAGKHAILQYALFDPQAGGPLLPDTERKVPLTVEDKDTQTSFVPIWVGYPKSKKFSAQFRLLEGNSQVRQIASTQAMRGSTYRYAC